MREYLGAKRQERLVLMEAAGKMRVVKVAQVFKAWRLARPKRIAYQTRIYNLFNYIAKRKQRALFFKL